MVEIKLMQVEKDRDRIDCNQNVEIKLTMKPKCKDQNDIFALRKKY